MKTAKIRREKFIDIIEEAKPLLDAQWHEIAHFREEIPLAVALDQYVKLEEAGAYFCITARVEGELVGYSTFYLVPEPAHYSTSPLAASDVIYLLPRYRKSGVGAELIKQTENLARNQGAKWITWHVKPESELDFSPYLLKQGYLLHEISCAKVL
jgi:GNAT superfamily N-acetyltransferase